MQWSHDIVHMANFAGTITYAYSSLLSIFLHMHNGKKNKNKQLHV